MTSDDQVQHEGV
jgi:hypothetical protein